MAISTIKAVYHVYTLASASGVLYTVVTSNLELRVLQHKQKALDGFSKKNGVTRLAFCQLFDQIKSTITREKQIKAWRRENKLVLILAINPAFRDLSVDFYQ